MMKSSTTGQLREPNITLRTRKAVRASIVLFISFLILLGISVYLTQSLGNTQSYFLATISILSAAICALAIRFSRQRRVELAAYLMIASLVVFCSVATFMLSGVGLTLGISSVVVILTIAALTLTPPQLTMANVMGMLFGVALILVDIFLPSERLEIQIVSIFLAAVAATSSIVCGYFVMQQFSNYPFRTKLILYFVLVAVISVGAVAVITNNLARNAVEKQVGQLQRSLAERLAFETGKELQNNVEILQATGTQFEEFAAGSNDLYVGEGDEIIQRIMDLDNRWSTAEAQSLLVRNVVNNEIADELREFQAHFPDHVELFVTDKYEPLSLRPTAQQTTTRPMKAGGRLLTARRQFILVSLKSTKALKPIL